MDVNIKPAIISKDFSELEYKADLVDDFVSWIHLDVMDGKFTKTESNLNPDDIELLEGKAKLEVHLMIEEPETELVWWSKVADRVLVHVEATENLNNIIDSLVLHRTKLGLSLLLETPLSAVEKYLDKVDLIQLMSIKEIGAHGNKFEMEVLNKIKELRKIWPSGIIQVDGGINLTTGAECLEAGANTLVVGSAIWQASDPLVTLKEFVGLE